MDCATGGTELATHDQAIPEIQTSGNNTAGGKESPAAAQSNGSVLSQPAANHLNHSLLQPSRAHLCPAADSISVTCLQCVQQHDACKSTRKKSVFDKFRCWAALVSDSGGIMLLFH